MKEEERLSRAQKYEEGMLRTYKKYAKEKNMKDDVTLLFRRLIQNKKKDLELISALKEKYCSG